MEHDREPERRYAYVVTDSSYGDYHIITIFSTQDDADAYVDRFNQSLRAGCGDLARVERWEIDAPRMIILARSSD